MHKQILRIERLHNLIKRRATGNPKDCAKRLGISERQLYNTLDIMKSMGAPIHYDVSTCAYCYKYNVDWQFGFSRAMDEERMSQIKGSGDFSIKNTPLQF